MSDWCILRTSGRSTLSLTASLAKDGFVVWTPVETRMIRVPRMNARRTVQLPILPSYVFASERHLVDLLQLAAMPVKPRRGAGLLEPAHADFSVMHAFGRIPLVSESSLAKLRELERVKTPKAQPRKSEPLQIGALIKIEGGSFGGMKGTVEASDANHTVVCFNGNFTVKITTSLLHPDELQEPRVAALKAA